MTKSDRIARSTLVMGAALAALGSTALLGACGTTSKKSSSVKQSATVGFLNELKSVADFERLQGIVDDIPLIRYSVLLDEPGEPFMFHNTARYPMHLDFLKAEVPKYKDLTAVRYSEIIDSPSQNLLQTGAVYFSRAHEKDGTSFPDRIGFVVYVKSSAMSAEDARNAFAKAYERVVRATEKSKIEVSLLLDGGDFFKHKTPLEKMGVRVAKYGTFVQSSTAQRTYNAAKSYGYLKVLSPVEVESGDYGSKDIVVLEEVPLDIAPVAGILTAKPQAANSHVIIRASNQKIPYAFKPGLLSSPELTRYRGQLVEFEATADGKILIAGADQIGESELKKRADEYFANRVPKLDPLNFDLATTSTLPFVGKPLSKGLATTYGAKGSNFALLDEALRASGVDRKTFDGAFLIPFSSFEQHMAQKVTVKACEKSEEKCSKAASAEMCKPAAEACRVAAAGGSTLRSFIDASYAPEKVESLLGNNALRRGTLELTRQLIRRTDLPSAVLEDVRKTIVASYPETVRIRLRSSTNAEDLAGLNGAGLYVSKAACLQDSLESKEGASACMTPVEMARLRARIADLEARLAKGEASVAKSLADLKEKLTDKDELKDALRSVYASIWTDKAFLTRDYYKLDHSKVYMGVLAHPSFVDENANGVAIVSEVDGGLKILPAVQKEDISVTNPEVAGALPEEWDVTTGVGGVVRERKFLRSSSISKDTRVMSDSQVDDLARQISIVQRKMRNVHGDVARKLDIEFIVDASGKVIIKQARPL